MSEKFTLQENIDFAKALFKQFKHAVNVYESKDDGWEYARYAIYHFFGLWEVYSFHLHDGETDYINDAIERLWNEVKP